MSSISSYKYNSKQILSLIKSLLWALVLTSTLAANLLITQASASDAIQNSTKSINGSTETKKADKVAATPDNGTTDNSKRAIDLHPDVWGYDLNDHKLIPKGYNAGSSYKAPDGDIVFKLSRCFQNCDQFGKEKYEYAMLWFFADKVDFLKNDKDLEIYNEKHQLKSDFSRDKAEIANGECVKTVYVPTAKLCQVNDLTQNIIIKSQCEVIDSANDEYAIAANVDQKIKRYSIIGAENNIYRYVDKEDGFCDRGGPGGGEIIYQQLYPVTSIIDLKDDSFLAFWGNIIVRFDSDLKTKFIPKRNIELAHNKIIKGNFFVLPYEKIEELGNKVARDNDHDVQGLQNELLLYLYRRAENK